MFPATTSMSSGLREIDRGEYKESANTRSDTMLRAVSPDWMPVDLQQGGSDTDPEGKTSMFDSLVIPLSSDFDNPLDRRLCVLIFR